MLRFFYYTSRRAASKQWQQNQTDSTRRKAYNENDIEQVIDQRKNKNSSIPGDNGVKKTYKRVRFREGFQEGTYFFLNYKL